MGYELKMNPKGMEEETKARNKLYLVIYYPHDRQNLKPMETLVNRVN